MTGARLPRAMRALPVLAVALLLAPFSPAVATEGVTVFTWEAPSETTGALAVRMTFDFGEENRCVFERQVSGLHLNGAVHSWEEMGEFGGAFRSIYTAQAHVEHDGLVVDTRTLRTSDGDWSLTSTTEGPHAGVVPFTLVVMDSGSWTGATTGYHAPMRIDVRCDAPFTVGGLHKGREAVGFSADHMQGGTGASANQLYGSATVVSGDAMEASFRHSLVNVRIGSEKWEGTTSGELMLTTPSGTTSHDLAAPLDVRVAAGPGDYRVALDYVAVSLYERVVGVAYGLDPVTSLDA